MLETRAIVIRLEGEEAIVEAAHGGCGSCGGGNGCGSANMSKMFCVKPRQFRVRNGIGANVGEEVEVSVAEGALIRSALTLYAVPLATLFVGALAGSHWLVGESGNDAGAALGAMAGLLAGFALAKFIALRQGNQVASSPAISRCRHADNSAML